jgi:endonuclease YncB( thermonuclease family)
VRGEQLKVGLSFALAAMAIAVSASAQTVVDGDTIKVEGTTHRLYGIDAPEKKQDCPDGWPAGREALAYLAGQIRGRSVECHHVEYDRYGRSVSICYAGGDDLSALMVSAGMALAFLRYSSQYQDAERRAAGQAQGLHAHNCIPPWEWRAHQRQ